MMVWIYLLIISVIIFLASIKYKYHLLGVSILFGILLALIDFIFQNLGAYFGLWFTSYSLYSLGVVPIEVFIMSIFAGSVVSRLSLDINPVILGMICAVSGSFIEYLLTQVGQGMFLTVPKPSLLYDPSWSPIHAFLAYYAIFTVFAMISRRVLKKLD